MTNDDCAPHRLYLGAIADGELDLVPSVTAYHVSRCHMCARMVVLFKMLNEKLLGRVHDEVAPVAGGGPQRRRSGIWSRWRQREE
jgi:hypothetical protein